MTLILIYIVKVMILSNFALATRWRSLVVSKIRGQVNKFLEKHSKTHFF